MSEPEQRRESGTFSDGRDYTIVRWHASVCHVSYYEQPKTIIAETISIDTWNHDDLAAELTVEQARSLAAFLLTFAEGAA